MENSREPSLSGSHGEPFWKVAQKDVLTLTTTILIVLVFFLQFFAIGVIFVTRICFGSHFDPIIYSEYQIEKSDTSMTEALRLKEARAARVAATSPTDDSITLSTEQALAEINQQTKKRSKDEIIHSEAEKTAERLTQEAEMYWKYKSYDDAIKHLQDALQSAPDYLPAIKKLAIYSEERKDLTQAHFQWEKAASIAEPGSIEMQEIQKNLDRLTSPTDGNKAILFADIKRNDLPLEDLYDLRFNLQISLNTRGENSGIDPENTRVEVSFYDQSTSAAGIVIPIKVLSSVLKPKERKSAADEQTLSLNYSVPRGYFRKHMQTFGSSYAFCGYTLKVFYRGALKDSYAQPPNILEKYSLASSSNETHHEFSN
jgi:tetratricopeptide (TPR) repeat protein